VVSSCCYVQKLSDVFATKESHCCVGHLLTSATSTVSQFTVSNCWLCRLTIPKIIFENYSTMLVGVHLVYYSSMISIICVSTKKKNNKFN
jgi:hypothetical protein